MSNMWLLSSVFSKQIKREQLALHHVHRKSRGIKIKTAELCREREVVREAAEMCEVKVKKTCTSFSAGVVQVQML